MKRRTLILTLVLSATALSGPADPPAAAPLVYTNWRTFSMKDGLPGNRILAVRVQGQRIWVGTDNGLALYEDDTWRSWTTTDGLPGPAITAIDWNDETHDLWLGTFGSGLVRFTGGRFDRFDQFNSGLAGDQVYDVHMDGNTVWAATNGGVSAYDVRNDAWELHLGRRAEMDRGPFTALAGGDRGNELIVAEWFGRVWSFDRSDGQWKAPASLRPSSNHAVESTIALSITTEGELIQATPTAINRRDANGQWITRNLAQETSAKTLVCAVATGSGSTLIGTDDGLQVVPKDRATPTLVYRKCETDGGPGMCVTQWRDGVSVAGLALPPGLPDNRVRCLARSEAGTWVGTEHGLAVAREPRPWTAAAEQDSTRRPDSTKADTYALPAQPDRKAPLDSTVRIAAARPITRMIRLPGASAVHRPAQQSVDLAAAELAVDLANGGSRYQSAERFEFVMGSHGYDRYAWGLPEDDWPGFALEKQVVGAVACIPPGDRYTTAAVLTAGLPVLNVATTPPSSDERLHPWIFRCPRYQASVHRAALTYAAHELGRSRWAVLRTPGDLTALHLDIWHDAAIALGHRPVLELPWDRAREALATTLERVEASGADAILTWTDFETTASIAQAMRTRGMTQLLVTGDAVGHTSHTQLAASGPPEIIATRLCEHPSPFVPASPVAHGDGARIRPAESPLQAFLERQPVPRRARTGPNDRRRDAILSFEGTNHLIHAVHVAGDSRRRDALSAPVQEERQAVQAGLGTLERSALLHWDGQQWRLIDVPGEAD